VHKHETQLNILTTSWWRYKCGWCWSIADCQVSESCRRWLPMMTPCDWLVDNTTSLWRHLDLVLPAKWTIIYGSINSSIRRLCTQHKLVCIYDKSPRTSARPAMKTWDWCNYDKSSPRPQLRRKDSLKNDSPRCIYFEKKVNVADYSRYGCWSQTFVVINLTRKPLYFPPGPVLPVRLSPASQPWVGKKGKVQYMLYM